DSRRSSVRAPVALTAKAPAPALHACVAPAGIGLSPKASAPALLRFDVAVGVADFPAVLARPAPRLNSQRSPWAHSARTVAAKHEDEARRLRRRAGRPALRSSAPRRRCAARTQPPSWRRWVACVRRSARRSGAAATSQCCWPAARAIWGAARSARRGARGGRAGRRHARTPFTLAPRLFDRSEPQVSEGSFRG